MLPNPVLTYDSDGRLEKVHCQPSEECNLDDSGHKDKVSWVEALERLIGTLPSLAPHGGNPFEPDVSFLPQFLCGHCFKEAAKA